MEALLVVVLGERVAAALLGDAVDDDGTFVGDGVAQHRLDAGDVVPVDRPDVADAERLEEVLRLDDLAERGPEAGHAGLQLAADEWDLVQRRLDPIAVADVAGVEPEAGEARRQSRDRRCVRTTPPAGGAPGPQ